MILFYAILVGVLYTAGFYMVMRRSLVKIIFGLIFLGHAANLLILIIGRVTQGNPPFIEKGAAAAQASIAEPLPQALILTAIVIGFGIQAFAIVLYKRVYMAAGHDDLDQLRSTDHID